MPSAVLKEPAYKMLLGQMKTAESISKQCYNASYNKWLVDIVNNDISKKCLSVSNIWVQGKVIQFNKASSGTDFEMLISDGSGVARVGGFNKLPKSVGYIKPNEYVMVIGHVTKVGELGNCMVGNNKLPLCTVLQAIKVTKLLNIDMWPNEVKDAQMHVLSCVSDV